MEENKETKPTDIELIAKSLNRTLDIKQIPDGNGGTIPHMRDDIVTSLALMEILKKPQTPSVKLEFVKRALGEEAVKNMGYPELEVAFDLIYDQDFEKIPEYLKKKWEAPNLAAKAEQILLSIVQERLSRTSAQPITPEKCIEVLMENMKACLMLDIEKLNSMNSSVPSVESTPDTESKS